MSDEAILIHEQDFSSSDSIDITHNGGCCVYVELIIDSDVRPDLMSNIVIDPTDPTNKFTLNLTSSQTGSIQVYREPIRAAGLPSPAVAAALSAVAGDITATNPYTLKDYVDSKSTNQFWLPPVIDRILTPPGSPSTGDRYLIDGTGTGAWASHDGEIAEYNGSGWDFTEPVDGTTTTVKDEDDPYTQTATSSPWVWVSGGGATAIHGNEKHSPDMLTVGSSRSDANLDKLTDGDEDDDVDALHLHIRRDKSKSYFWDDFVGYHLNGELWYDEVVGASSSVNTISGGTVLGGQVKFRSGTVVDDYALMSFHERRPYSLAAEFVFECRIFCEELADSSFVFGLLSSGSEYIRFSRSGTGNWFAQTYYSTQTSTDTSVSSDTDWHIFRIEGETGSAKFYIDGTLEATITTNLTTGGFEPYFVQTTISGTAYRDSYIDWIEITGGRAT